MFYSILLLAIGIFTIHETINSHKNIYDKKLENYYQDFAAKLEELHLAETVIDREILDDLILINERNVKFQVYDSNRNLISSNIKLFNFDEELDEALLSDLEGFVDAYDTEASSEHYYYNFKEIKFGPQSLIFAGRIRAFELDLAYYKQYLFLVFIIPIYVVIITLLSFQLSKAAFKPIINMIHKAKKISSTNLHRRLDVTEPKDEIRELAITLNGMIDRLEKSFDGQKNFVANASHEFKTPLTIIRADLENLKDGRRNEKSDEDINKIINEVDRLTNLSRSLLKLSKIDSGESYFDLIRVDELLVECSQTFYKKASEKNINFNISLDGDTEIIGDKEKLISVFQNLIDNSIKYSECNKNIYIGAKKRSEFVVITIEDKGFGIKEDDIDKIYNRFYRSNEHRASIQGNGLGLSIVSEIVRVHNGKIICNSKLGKGTVFKVTLPIKQ